MCDGRATDIFIGAIYLHEQCDIDAGVLAGKGGSRGAVALGEGHGGQAVFLPARYQAGDLRAAVATGVAQVGQHHTALSFAALRVVKAPQYAADVFVALSVNSASGECKFDFWGWRPEIPAVAQSCAALSRLC